MKCPNDGMELVASSRTGQLNCPLCPFNMVPNTKTFAEMWIWLSVDPQGMEGTIAVEVRPGTRMVLMNANKRVAEELREVAERAVSTAPGYSARLARFRRWEEVQ